MNTLVYCNMTLPSEEVLLMVEMCSRVVFYSQVNSAQYARVKSKRARGCGSAITTLRVN